MRLATEVAHEVRGEALEPHPASIWARTGVIRFIDYLLSNRSLAYRSVKNNLFLGRFLNEALHSVPDIDLDFPTIYERS